MEMKNVASYRLENETSVMDCCGNLGGAKISETNPAVFEGSHNRADTDASTSNDNLFHHLCHLIGLSAAAAPLLKNSPGNVPALVQRAIREVVSAMMAQETQPVDSTALIDRLRSVSDSTLPFIHRSPSLARTRALLDKAQRHLGNSDQILVAGHESICTLPDQVLLVLLFMAAAEDGAAWFLSKKFLAVNTGPNERVVSLTTDHNDFITVGRRLLVSGDNSCSQRAWADPPDTSTHTPTHTPTLVRLPPVVYVEAFPVDGDTSCISVFAVTEGGVFAWGANPHAVLGLDCDMPVVPYPHRVEIGSSPAEARIVSVPSATFFSVGGVWSAAGLNTAGRLGVGSSDLEVTPPRRVDGLHPTTHAFQSFTDSSDSGVTFALTKSRATPVLACGSNQLGQLGVGGRVDLTVFSPVIFHRAVTIDEVDCVVVHGRLAVTIFFSDDRIFVCGHNPNRMIVPSDSEFITTPVEIPFPVDGAFFTRPSVLGAPWPAVVYAGRPPGHSAEEGHVMYVSHGATVEQFSTTRGPHEGWDRMVVPDAVNTVEFFGIGIFAVRVPGTNVWACSPVEGPGELRTIHGRLSMSQNNMRMVDEAKEEGLGDGKIVL
ncbi:Regulator of chromosome condensation (RCC1) repeat [Carpediemonas membranifera]|uniref:Regulator of chromosome condensation (RCC1) repeat n=1 Tax=Carpediemonas membranifera TaxID=201153 RepID=A0A8J6AXI4_9EUKA|nr:Regulator of chromosome condensation (RCC1) repeat [Carpediemonas membranifera]|eukprot:KAG9394940.1 Regulator of chromosome condensation (RCC1) repeat [Carpediemonas membranifera]